MHCYKQLIRRAIKVDHMSTVNAVQSESADRKRVRIIRQKIQWHVININCLHTGIEYSICCNLAVQNALGAIFEENGVHVDVLSSADRVVGG